jgi:GT2 family glycosyltransferase
MATFMLVRREAFDAVGRFDEAQWMHAEDLDLGWRLHEAGWKAVYEPDAVVYHVGSAASKKAFGDELMLRYMAASYAWMARRRGIGFARTIALLNTLGAAVRLAPYQFLASVRPARFAQKRDTYRYWLAVHGVGLKRRSELMRHS